MKSNRPVHRASVSTFGKVARSGYLASHHCLQTSSTDGQFAVQLPSVVTPLCDHPESAQGIIEFVDAVAKHCVAKSTLDQASSQSLDFLNPRPPVLAEGAQGGKRAELQRLASEVTRLKANLGLPEPRIARMKADVEAFLGAKLEQQRAMEAAAVEGGEVKMGIGYQYDRLVETNKMIFAILGPHTFKRYGEDPSDPRCEGVHLIFSNAILHHPDVFLTPMAATFYNSGAGDGHRPWSPTGKDNGPKSYYLMLKEKLHPSAPRCFEALAWDFIARAAKKARQPA